MFSHLLLLLLSFLLLGKGADYLVEACARIAKKLGVSEVIIGLTFVALGTSLPELASSVVASFQNYPGIVLGNVIGSNIANIGLILGAAALFGVIRTNKQLFHRDAYILLFSVVLLYFLAADGALTKLDGAILLLVYIVYIIFLVQTQSGKNHKFRHFLEYIFGLKYLQRAHLRNHLKLPNGREIWQDLLLALLSGAAVVFGARFLVKEAVWLAGVLSIPNNLVALSVVAVGTSVPELVVSIQAVRKGFGGIVVGNILGSNIANMLMVIGAAASARYMAVPHMTIAYTLPIMAFFTLGLVYLVRGKRFSAWAGMVLLVSYVVFLFMAFQNGWA